MNKKYSSSTASQRQRILFYLREHSRLTTLKARKELDVMLPAARVQELRAKGINIVTHRRWEATEKGEHQAAEYVLMSPCSSSQEME